VKVLSQGQVIDIAQEALFTILKLCAPMLGLGLVVGLIVAIFQATTQIHEQTLVFVPKILAVIVAIIIFGPWMLNLIVDFTNQLYGSIGTLIQ